MLDSDWDSADTNGVLPVSIAPEPSFGLLRRRRDGGLDRSVLFLLLTGRYRIGVRRHGLHHRRLHTFMTWTTRLGERGIEGVIGQRQKLCYSAVQFDTRIPSPRDIDEGH